MWKHWNEDQPALYNAIDADVTLRCWSGIYSDLKKAGLWPVFERHVVKLNTVLSYMREKGVQRDNNLRQEAEDLLAQGLQEIDGDIQTVIPREALQLKVYKRTPPDTEGMIQTSGLLNVKVCPNCKEENVTAPHYKSIGKKRLSKGEPENPCHGHKSEKRSLQRLLWAMPLPFKVSKASLLRYQDCAGHIPVFDQKKKTITFDDTALKTLCSRYPSDPLYPLISKFRETQKLLGTYVGVTDESGTILGGMPVGADGRIHTLFTHNPSTLRLASQNPNLQNLPRPAGKDDPQTLIRRMVVAGKGMVFTAADFSGIEALLVGYEAQAPDYMRLAKIDVHSFYTAYCLNSQDPGKFPSKDLPSLGWDDDLLRSRLADIKREFKWERNTLYKHLVHAINFGQEAKGASNKIYKETGVRHDIKIIRAVMDVYRELFPAISNWHTRVKRQADKEGYLRNAFGYIHRFNRVFDKRLIGGKWQSSNGPDSSKVLAFLPQSNAAGIIKEAMLKAFFDHYEEVGQWLRLTIHDEIICECPISMVDAVEGKLVEIMAEPVKAMPLPKSWGMGDYLCVEVESKRGYRWAEME